MNCRIKIVFLWLLTICGLSCHSITDLLPIFWGKDLAVFASDGCFYQSMIICMMSITFLIPSCGIMSVIYDFSGKGMRYVNLVLATLIALFNLLHAFMELPSDITAQYIILPLLILIGFLLFVQSFKFVKE